MSPHLYIVYFFICVKLSSCYQYYEENANAKRDAKKNPEIIHDQRKHKLRRNPNAQFDLADFLNVANENVHGDENYDYNVKNLRSSKNYNEYGSIIDTAENIKKRDDSSDFLNGAYDPAEININPSEHKNLNNKQFNTGLNNEKVVNNRDDKAVTLKIRDQLAVERSMNHHPEKKCSFKNMKFPFFSHKKSQTSKKTKKRKMFCLNCKKEDTESTSTEAYTVKNKNKRSYVDKLCPECKRKFRAVLMEDIDDDKESLNQRIVHNSRQYFAAIDDQATEKLDNKRVSRKEDTDFSISFQNPRSKREDFDERARKLEELEVIQKKVDSVEVHMPHFDKPIQM